MFRAASRELHGAASFALYAERMTAVYAEMKAIQNAPLAKGAAFVAQAPGKVAAAQAIPLIEAVLFPKDD